MNSTAPGAPEDTVPGPVVLRPSWASYRAWLRRGSTPVGLMLLGLVIAFLMSDSRRGLLVAIGVIVALVAVSIGVVALVIARTSVTLEDDRVVHSRLSGRTALNVSDGLVGLLATQSFSYRGFARVTDILVISRRPAAGERHGRGRRLRLTSGFFTREQLEQIAGHAGPGVEILGTVYSVKDFDHVVPGTSRWAERHATALGIGIGLGVPMVAVVAVLGFLAVTDRAPFDPAPPREVSTTTVERQDGVVDAVTSALGGDWVVAEAFLRECTDDDGHKGWQRSVDAVPRPGTSSPPASEPLLEQLGDVLVTYGYGDLTATTLTGDAALTGRVDTEPEGRSRVRVDFDSVAPEISARSGCEAS